MSQCAINRNIKWQLSGISELEFEVPMYWNDSTQTINENFDLINAGGIINVYGEIVGYGKEEAHRRTENIYNTTLEIFRESELQQITTHQAALCIAEKRIAEKIKENANRL